MRGDAFRLLGLGLTGWALISVPGCLAKFDKDYPVVDRDADVGGAAGVAATGMGGEVGTAGAQAVGGAAGAMTAGAGGAARGEGGTAPTGGGEGGGGADPTGGVAGTVVTGGTGGALGTAGAAGSSGVASTAGAAGTAGNLSAAGSAGAAGIGGNAGTAGVLSMAGTAGAAGSTASGGSVSDGGAAGFAGAPSAGGSPGLGGAVGVGGSAGVAGSAGTAGAAGSAGSAGVAGAAGNAGASGAGGGSPSCTDNELNQDETDVDCGGTFCDTCPDGSACNGPADCETGVCHTGVCGSPSCAGGLDCNGHSCCQSYLVPGGTFPMGRSLDSSSPDWNLGSGGADEVPEHDVTVSPFYLDKFEVTVGRMRSFRADYDAWRTAGNPHPGDGIDPGGHGVGWQAGWEASLPADATGFAAGMDCDFLNEDYENWTATVGARENYAVNCINFRFSFAFCIWDGGRLPTEAEFEFAAAGGAENRLYPWGQDPPGLVHANYNATANHSRLDVGSYPLGDGLWGHSDIAGNLHEWLLDLYSDTWYSHPDATLTDPLNVAVGSYHPLRGGSFENGEALLRAASRHDSSQPNSRSIGFRCARSP